MGDRHSYSRLPTPDGYGYTGMDYTVEARETVAVAAGSFDSYRVECVGRWNSNGGAVTKIRA